MSEQHLFIRATNVRTMITVYFHEPVVHLHPHWLGRTCSTRRTVLYRPVLDVVIQEDERGPTQRGNPGAGTSRRPTAGSLDVPAVGRGMYSWWPSGRGTAVLLNIVLVVIARRRLFLLWRRGRAPYKIFRRRVLRRLSRNCEEKTAISRKRF